MNKPVSRRGGAISLHADGRLVITGAPPYDAVFTPRLVRAVLECPPEKRADVKGPTIQEILSGLTPMALNSFDTSVLQDDQLLDMYGDLRRDFAAVAYPKVGRWPDPPPSEVVEEILVDMPPISVLVFTTEGRRYLREDFQDPTLVTFAEFQYRFGRSVSEFMRTKAPHRIRCLKRAMMLVADKKPQRFEIHTYDPSTQAVDTPVVVYLYSQDQVDHFVRRQGRRLLYVNTL